VVSGEVFFVPAEVAAVADAAAFAVSGRLLVLAEVVVVSGAATAVVSDVLAGGAEVESEAAREVPGFSQAIERRSAMELTEAARHRFIYTSNQQVHSGWCLKIPETRAVDPPGF